ncbi:MAG: flagellar hook capping FlgD N-terminal domain-containing protein [Acetobacteraceae bacterium]
MSLSATTAAASAATSSSTSSTSSTALNSLSGNLTDFLKLLMTQLKNQDPSSPTDTNQFTTELVQFAGVEQQINTNSSLTKLIQATQDNSILQSGSLTGKQVKVTSDHMPLQNGTGALQFDSASPETVQISVYAESGLKLRDASVTSKAGSNSWTWDGRDNKGTAVTDGSYKVSVAGASGSVPFTVTGTATGMQRSNGAVKVAVGALQANLTDVQAITNGSN